MILGITGKSGSGKHTAAQFFAQKGWKVLDVDKIAHRLYHPYQRVWREVVEHFGEGILTKDDLIDRQKLKKMVFGKSVVAKKALFDLNEIVHPELKRYLKDEIYFLKKKKANTVVIAALWEELELFEMCDKVLLVQAPEALAYERLHKRDGLDPETYEVTIANQKEPDKADLTVINDGNVQELCKKLSQLIA